MIAPTREEETWDRILERVPARGVPGAGTPFAPADRESEGLLEDIYLPLLASPDLAIAQLGQTLDGRIATVTGHSRFVTGPEDIRHLHRLRALVDAVVVGAGTVVADDPLLTVREVRGPSPVRVVLDPSGRVPTDARLFRDGTTRTLWLRGERVFGHPAPAGVEVVTLGESGRRGFEPGEILRELARRGLRRVLVEGGGITVSRFLGAGVLDRLHITVAPVLLGSGRAALTLPPIETLDKALRPPCRRFVLGGDVLFDFQLKP